MWEHELEGKDSSRPRRKEEAGGEGNSQASRALAALASGRSVSPSAVHHLQRAAGNAAVAELLDQDHSPVLDVVGKGGKPLDEDTKSFMEGRMGSDFSDVRVHTDAKASESARAVQAHAYTVGTDIVFDSDTYDPGSEKGKRMLAHELTHVGQQAEGEVDGTPAGGGISISDPSDRFERAAEANADRVMAGGHTETSSGAAAGAGGGASVQRDESEVDEDEGDETAPPVQRVAAEEETEDETEEG